MNGGKFKIIGHIVDCRLAFVKVLGSLNNLVSTGLCLYIIISRFVMLAFLHEEFSATEMKISFQCVKKC